MAASNVATIPERPAWAKSLDDREYLWTAQYLIDLNASRAAQDGLGAKPSSARVIGHGIKHRPQVRAALDMALRDRLPSLKLTLAERLMKMATADPADYFQVVEKRVTITTGKGKTKRRRTFMQAGVQVTPTKKLSEEQRIAIKGVKQRTGLYGTTIELQLHDPMQAGLRLAELLGLQQIAQDGAGGGVVFIIEAPDGAAIGMRPAGAIIDQNAVDALVAKNTAAPDVEDLPPGAKKAGPISFESP